VLQATAGLEQWHSINWSACSRKIKSLQRRIVKAIQSGNWRKVKRLRFLLTRSFGARALAVKRVTENSGKRTAGIDGELWNTPKSKVKAIETLSKWQNYQPKPLRRIYIPKKNGKKRPLSIPSMEDRARQALHLHALLPITETLADNNSYGFRPKRGCADALSQCFKVLVRKTSSQWVLEADIKGFFDNIDFAWLLENIPVNKKVLTAWLHSGYVEKGNLFPTLKGVPQGGVISPALGNKVLDGLEALINETSSFQRAHKIHFVRYADDFIVTASTKEVLEDIIKPKIERFLAERGVALSPEKTKITHITDGFDFLGQNIRKHKTNKGLGKIQIKPSKDSLKRMKTKISVICKTSSGLSQLALIEQLNPVLRGWANYHRHSICSKAFSEIDSHVFSRIFRWARRRHPDKTGQWIGDRYFSHRFKQRWTFEDKPTGKQLIRIARYFKFQRHIKVIAQANPFDPEWEDYFKQRNRKQVKKSSFGLRAKVLKHCCWICRVCWQPIQSDDKLDLHHIDGDHLNDKLDNLQLLHPNCHRQLHHREG